MTEPISTAPNATTPTGTQKTPVAKLWGVMFFQYFIWGVWLPLLFGYLGPQGLGFTGTQQTLILISFPMAALFSVFFGNQFADRNFDAEKFLAVSHLLSGATMVGLYFSTSFWAFMICMWAHAILFVPTISVANSVLFAAMKNPKSEYGLVRLGGTFGWMSASWPMFFLLSDDPMAVANTFLVAAIASFLFAGFSLTLPHTPANRTAKGLAWWQAIKTLSIPFVFVIWIVTMMDSSIHDLYFMWAGSFIHSVGVETKWIMPIMSIGQLAEIASMFLIGGVLTRLGWKWTLVIGLSGQVARFALFAFFPSPAMVILGLILHGMVYAFFFATLFIFVDEFLPKEIRASAHGVFNLMMLGGGPILSRLMAPHLFESHSTMMPTDANSEPVMMVDYSTLFLYPLGMSIAAVLLIVFAFHPPRKTEQK